MMTMKMKWAALAAVAVVIASMLASALAAKIELAQPLVRTFEITSVRIPEQIEVIAPALDSTRWRLNGRITVNRSFKSNGAVVSESYVMDLSRFALTEFQMETLVPALKDKWAIARGENSREPYIIQAFQAALGTVLAGGELPPAVAPVEP